MKISGEISGIEAIMQINKCRIADTSFAIRHLTYDRKLGMHGWREVAKCKARKALKENSFSIPGDILFAYTDDDTNTPGMAYKRLIRYISFTQNIWLKINWFN